MLFDAFSEDKKSYVSLLEQAEAAAIWLTSHGARVDSTRIASHIARLRSRLFVTGSVKSTPPEHWSHLWQLSEVHDLVEIHRCLSSVKDANFFETLRKTTSGPILLADEGTEGGSIQARNAAFELFTAARLARAGLPVSFNTKADVTAMVEGVAVAVECKRVSSAEALDDRIKEAHKQIRRRIAANEAQFGLIAVSLSRLVHQVSQEQPDSVAGDPKILQLALGQMVADWGPVVTRLFGGFAPSTIAIILQYKFPFINITDGTPTMLSRFVTYPLISENAGPAGKINEAIRAALVGSVGG